MKTLTVYLVYHEKSDTYYGSGYFRMVPLKDAKIFSKKNTATACSKRSGCEVVACTLTVPGKHE